MTPPPDDALEARGPKNRKGPKGSTGFVDEFQAWDPGRWLAQEHPLGRGWFRTPHVAVSGDALLLTLPAGTHDGGEVRSVDTSWYGFYEARMKVAAAPGTISTFFLYESGRKGIDEIDIEVFGDGSRRAFFTTWQRDRQTNHLELVLDFDPTAGFHDYAIDYRKDRVRFLVDGREVASFTHKLPNQAMFVMANAWWPKWLHGDPLATDGTAAYDRISVTP